MIQLLVSLTSTYTALTATSSVTLAEILTIPPTSCGDGIALTSLIIGGIVSGGKARKRL